MTRERTTQRRLVLIVCGEAAATRFLKKVFQEAYYTTVCASSGEEGLRELSVRLPDIAVIELPQSDGLDLCRSMREASHIPIMVLSSTREEEESCRIGALEAGADSYLVQPASGEELIARAEALSRRLDWSAAASAAYEDSRVRVDFVGHRVFVDGEEIVLTFTEYSLLCVLLQRPGQELTYEFLTGKVWSEEYKTPGLVQWHVSHLRRKLGLEPSPIKTVFKHGYRYDFDSS